MIRTAKGAATPLAEMRNLIDEDPRYEEAIFSYIGGEEVNTSPTHAYHRYAINFFDYPLRREEMLRTWRQADEDQRRIWLQTGVVPQDYPKPVAADWPSLLSIVEEKTKPERDVQSAKRCANAGGTMQKNDLDSTLPSPTWIECSQLTAAPRLISLFHSFRRTWCSRIHWLFCPLTPAPPSASSNPALTKSGRVSSRRR